MKTNETHPQGSFECAECGGRVFISKFPNGRPPNDRRSERSGGPAGHFVADAAESRRNAGRVLEERRESEASQPTQ
jgi:hypothetical protein